MIAIIGMATLMPGSRTYRDFWRDILRKKDYITDVPEAYWRLEDYYDADPKAPDKTYGKRGSFLDPIDFPPLEFGIPPKTLENIDTAQLLSLVVANEVFQDAFDTHKSDVDHSDVSVILGVTGAQKMFCEASARLAHPAIQKAMIAAGLPQHKIEEVLRFYAAQHVEWTEATFPGLLGNVTAGRVSNRLNFNGENCIVDAACASSLAAINLGMQKLKTRQSNVVIAGGADTANGIPMFVCFSKTPALSPTQDCRPFAEDADGTLLGEGIAMFVLKRLEDAERDADDIYAVIRGLGNSSDGRHKSIYAPYAAGQVKALERCYAEAGYAPDTVELLEAHGTGTKAGDKAEVEALMQVFQNKEQRCAIGSAKSQYGHTKGSAGAVGMAKAICALSHKIVPPTIKVESPINLENTPFYISNDYRPWFENADHPRRAGISAFGFGGSNYHITLEEYQGKHRKKKTHHFPCQVWPISAPSFAALKEAISAISTDAYIASEYMDAQAYHYQQSFDPCAPYRLALLVSTHDRLLEQIQTITAQLNEDSTCAFASDIFYAQGEPVKDQSVRLEIGDIALLTGMDIVAAFDCARKVFEQQACGHMLYPKPWVNCAEKQTCEERLQANAAVVKKTLHEALSTLLSQFNIIVNEHGQKTLKIDTHTDLVWLMRTLAEFSVLGVRINYSFFLSEFDVMYEKVVMPKFSVKIAGYNCGKPSFDVRSINEQQKGCH